MSAAAAAAAAALSSSHFNIILSTSCRLVRRLGRCPPPLVPHPRAVNAAAPALLDPHFKFPRHLMTSTTTTPGIMTTLDKLSSCFVSYTFSSSRPMTTTATDPAHCRRSLTTSSSSCQPHQEKTVHLPSNNQIINFVQVGSGSRKILMLPGALGTGAGDFGPQLDPSTGLATLGDFTVLAWDPPGYGKSRPPARSWPADFFDRDAASAAELIKAVGEKKQTT